jgi:putative transposase
MVRGLKRYQQTGHLQFVTFSCYRRQGHLETVTARDLFEDALERIRYDFHVVGYVVMLEHIHLLVSEPRGVSLAVCVQALKLSVARRSEQKPFWQPRYYDFNVFTEEKRVEKLEYMHWNPVRRGLVEKMEEWPWSSYRWYCSGEKTPVCIESAWTTQWKPKQGSFCILYPRSADPPSRKNPRSQRRDLGHPRRVRL